MCTSEQLVSLTGYHANYKFHNMFDPYCPSMNNFTISLFSSAGGGGNLEMPGDMVKLKKHLTVFFDQLEKGGRLKSSGEFSNWLVPSRDLMKRYPVSLPTVNDVIEEETKQY